MVLVVKTFEFVYESYRGGYKGGRLLGITPCWEVWVIE